MTDYYLLHSHAIFLAEYIRQIGAKLEEDDPRALIIVEAHNKSIQVVDFLEAAPSYKPEEVRAEKLEAVFKECIPSILAIRDVSPALHRHPDREVGELYEKGLWVLEKMSGLAAKPAISAFKKWEISDTMNIHPLVVAMKEYSDQICQSQTAIRDLTGTFYPEFSSDWSALDSIQNLIKINILPTDMMEEKYMRIKKIAEKLESNASPTKIGEILEANLKEKDVVDHLSRIAFIMIDARNLLLEHVPSDSAAADKLRALKYETLIAARDTDPILRVRYNGIALAALHDDLALEAFATKSDLEKLEKMIPDSLSEAQKLAAERLKTSIKLARSNIPN